MIVVVLIVAKQFVDSSTDRKVINNSSILHLFSKTHNINILDEDPLNVFFRESRLS